MKSRTDFTGSCGWTTSVSWLAAICTTGAKLFTGSNGSFGVSAGVVAKEVAVISRTWPSGAALATKSLPMMPVAPARLSMTTLNFRRSASRGPSVRAAMSAPVPGE